MSMLDTELLGSMPAPEPMAPLKNVIITPDNIALEARLNRAKPLGRFKLWRLKRQLKGLERRLQKLTKNNAPELTQMSELRASLKTLTAYRDDLALKREADPEDKTLQVQWQQMLETALPLQRQYEALRGELRSLIALQDETKFIRQQIADNPRVIEKKKEEDKLIADQTKEAKTYEQFLINRLTHLGYCYRWTDTKGNKRIDEVGFSYCEIAPDAIYYKIAISQGGMFGGWRDRLPYGVRIADLIKDETCFELSQSCQRQVTSKTTSVNGSWLIVHRLDTNDGLLSKVRYASVMDVYPHKAQHKIPICAGVGYNLKPLWLFITDYPHMLVAGFTGSGKSNFINALICTLISHHSPDDLRIMLVDLKDGIEFSAFEHIPHVHGKVVDKVIDLADRLQELEAIMADRNQLLRGKAKNLTYFNAKYPDQKLPRIICIIDEVASIMAQGETTKRINNSLRQLTAKGRAAGVHIILSTQRPSVDAIDGGIKVNLPVRIVGRMPSHADSLTVLGTGDAKNLSAVPGRMILQVDPDPRPIQTPFIDEEDIADALRIAMQYPTPEPLPVPEIVGLNDGWTADKLIALSIDFLGGNISHSKIWEEIKEEGTISRTQLRQKLEPVWEMDCIPYHDKQYQVEKGAHGRRRLVEIDQVARSPVPE